MYDDERQPELPLDERFRRAQQYSLDLIPVQAARKVETRQPLSVCIGNCNICPRCGNSNNRDKSN